jgi:1-deoxy-D-xylulose-5-phosphate reductoisomerase
MSEIIESTMGKVSFIKNPSYDDYVETNIEARQIANDLCKQYFL